MYVYHCCILQFIISLIGTNVRYFGLAPYLVPSRLMTVIYAGSLIYRSAVKIAMKFLYELCTNFPGFCKHCFIVIMKVYLPSNACHL